MYIAYMHFYDRHLTLFHGIAERHGRVAVASCVKNDTFYIICVLNPVDQVSFVVRLLIDEMHVGPISLDLQQNLCHAF